ncbi:MAG TPA: GNAT family N-acetyltransferase [Candidatus Tumulicola sp.]
MFRNIELLVCTEDDWQFWRDVRIAALTEAPYAYGSTLGSWEGAAEERWRARLRSVAYNIVATLDGAAAGLVSGAPEGDGSVTLISMWVAPFARGQGIGDRLVRSVLEWARGRGAPVVRLDVVSNNGPAIELYRRNGFVDVGPSSHCEIEGVPQRDMVYRFESSP